MSSKAAFVRSMPASMPASEVVAKAKTKRINISANYVYEVRAQARKKPKTAAIGTNIHRRPTPPSPKAPASTGLEHAIEAIVEAKVNALLRERFSSAFG